MLFSFLQSLDSNQINPIPHLKNILTKAHTLNAAQHQSFLIKQGVTSWQK